MIPTLQYYKYIYAVRLIDYGLANEALHYLEEVAAHIVKRPGTYIHILMHIYSQTLLKTSCTEIYQLKLYICRYLYFR
jgi:hypothetical protein